MGNTFERSNPSKVCEISRYDPTSAPAKRKAPSKPAASAAKKPKVEAADTLDMTTCVKDKSVNRLTVAVLKDYLVGNGVDVKGMKKADLVQKVYDLFA